MELRLSDSSDGWGRLLWWLVFTNTSREGVAVVTQPMTPPSSQSVTNSLLTSDFQPNSTYVESHQSRFWKRDWYQETITSGKPIEPRRTESSTNESIQVDIDQKSYIIVKWKQKWNLIVNLLDWNFWRAFIYSFWLFYMTVLILIGKAL